MRWTPSNSQFSWHSVVEYVSSQLILPVGRIEWTQIERGCNSAPCWMSMIKPHWLFRRHMNDEQMIDVTEILPQINVFTKNKTFRTSPTSNIWVLSGKTCTRAGNIKPQTFLSGSVLFRQRSSLPCWQMYRLRVLQRWSFQSKTLVAWSSTQFPNLERKRKNKEKNVMNISQWVFQ